MRAAIILALSLSSALPVAATAQMAPPAPPAPIAAPAPEPTVDCSTVRVAMPREFAGWGMRTPLMAGTAPRNAPVLPIGRGADLTLSATSAVTAPAAPGKAPAADSRSGLAMFQVSRAGTFRVALGAPAWIDIVQAGRVIASTAHGHGPVCTGIRKIVDFRLSPGRYVLHLSGAETATVPVLIARAAK